MTIEKSDRPENPPDSQESGAWNEDWTELRETFSRQEVRIAALVLEARAIPCRSHRSLRGWRLEVPARDLERAAEELTLYRQENRDWPPPAPAAAPHHANTLITLSVLGLLGIFHNLTYLSLDGFGHSPIDWLALGNADAGKILAGQWWRGVTALTLHSDALHLLGNLVIGGFFVDRLCREIGAGVGWALVLASGVLGNLANALLQPAWHQAVGASTAVFGAVGILAVRSALRHRKTLLQRWLLPVAAALALLGLLGTGGERTDIGAHLLGFLAGLSLGWPAARISRYSRTLGFVAGGGAVLLTVGAWLAALSWGP
jgi:membrane associated rhomboid family serine protease